MSKKNVTAADIDSLSRDFSGNQINVSNKDYQRENRKRSYLIDADDSTDDEAVSTGVNNYKLENRWNAFKDNIPHYDYKQSINEEDLKYSFILHAFGRGIYYSEPVNAIYEANGGLKEKYLKKVNNEPFRKTLTEENFPIDKGVFESEIDYIANRRITDRSEKRKESNDNNLPKNRFNMPETIWNFASANAIETKGVKKITNTSRDDWTLYKGEEIPYLQKKSTIWVENLTTNLSGVPTDDAEQIRAVFRGDNLEGLDNEKLEKLAFLANLFFGPETSRSPVGFASHQMFLDLIGSDQVGFRTWDEAFNCKNFPQMGGGAINALRLLNDDYNSFMPYNYRYDSNKGFEDNRIFNNSPLSPQTKAKQEGKSIISAEARIAKAWLALKFPHEPQTPETLMKFLPNQIADWYRGVDLMHFVPEAIQINKRNINSEESSPQKGLNLNYDFEEDSNIDIINFHQEHKFCTKINLVTSSQAVIAKLPKKEKYPFEELANKHADKLYRCLTDDERFVCLEMECYDTDRLSIDTTGGQVLKPNYEEGFAEIKRGDELLAICPIKSISTENDDYRETFTKFIHDHKGKNTKLIFSIDKSGYHYTTLALSPRKRYRYIDSMHDSEDGEIEHDGLRSALKNLGYSNARCSYKRQQHSGDMWQKSGGIYRHNNEGAFHNIYTTIRIAQSQGIAAYLGNMNKYGMTMLDHKKRTLTPEFACDFIRPFYEEFFENLRNIISNEKEILNNINFHQEHELCNRSNCVDSYNKARETNNSSLINLASKHRAKLNRYLTDDERFICLWMECDENGGLTLLPDYQEGFAEIKKGDELLAICPIGSISIDHDSYKKTITAFINDHESKNTKLIFSIHGSNHFTTLALNATKGYRYIDSMRDSEDGEIEHDGLRSALEDLGYSNLKCPYKKQQYSETMRRKSGGVIVHNNECAFHNIYTTIRIAQSQDIGSVLGDMNRYDMTMLGHKQKTLTPEFARDCIRPFYEEFFENLRKIISDEKEIMNNDISDIESQEQKPKTSVDQPSGTQTSVITRENSIS